MHILSENMKSICERPKYGSGRLQLSSVVTMMGHFSEVLQFANTTRGGIINLQGSDDGGHTGRGF